MKKFYFIARNKEGSIIFNHRSDKAYKLLAMAQKESHDGSGAMYGDWYFGSIETNVSEDIIERVNNGEKI